MAEPRISTLTNVKAPPHSNEAEQSLLGALMLSANAFDKVAVMYVASVVPDPRAMIREVQRVCRPGGDIFVLNHFASQGNRVVRQGENLLAPLSRALGFHPHFELDDFIAMADMPVVEIKPVNAFGYWTLVHLRNE